MAEQMEKNQARFSGQEIGDALNIESDFCGTVVGVETDSRRIEKDNLFIALRGEKFDGHEFLKQVQAQGAAAAIVEAKCDIALPQIVVPDTLNALGDLARFHRQRFNIPVVAVTGSYGKTSTRALIHAALSAQLETLTSQANFNNEIGLPMTLFQLDETHQAAVLEMGMRGLKQIDYLAVIAEPTIAVITNIGPQHIELLESVENIAAAKAELIENLPPDGLTVLPADSPFLPMLRGKAPCRFVTFGLANDADYRVENVRTDDYGDLFFDLRFGKNIKTRVRLPLIGAHNAVNAAAALAVAHQLGIELGLAAWHLENVQLPGARMRVIQTETLTIIDDCYNAGPDSMRAALETLRDFPGAGRRVAVLGAMRELGAHSDEEHRKLGALAGEICDVVVGVGPETQPMLDAIGEDDSIICEWSADAKGAISIVQSRLQKGDVVLVKGSRGVGLEIVVENLEDKS